jgi:DNA-binding transcriptional LysR family regulator
MTNPTFQALDLNLLRVFDALYIERNATRAGHRIGLTQSGISHSLARLRQYFSDDLFIGSAGGMRPSPLAREIGPKLHTLLVQMQTTLNARHFDPPTAERIFSIACGDYTATVLLPRILAKLDVEAPHVHLRILPLHQSNMDQLEDGELDIIIANFQDPDERFEAEYLLEERFVCAMDRNHPRASLELTVKELAELPLIIPGNQIGMFPSGHPAVVVWRGLELQPSWRSALFDALEVDPDDVTPHPRRVSILNSFAAITMVKGTSYAALLPLRMVKSLATELGLSLRNLPFELSHTPLQMLSHRIHGVHAAELWLRDMFKRTAHEVEQACPLELE